MGRPLGWAWTLSPRGGRGCGSPWVLVPPWTWCVTGQSGVNIVQMFCFGQGVRVTFGGHDLMRQRRMVSFRGGQGGSRTATTGEESPGSAAVRLQEGWIPASAGKTDGGWQCGTAPARPFDPPQRTYSRLRVSSPSLDSGSGAGMMGDGVGLGIK